MKPAPLRIAFALAAAAVVLISWALDGRPWIGTLYDALGFLALFLVALPSMAIAEMLGDSNSLFSCNMFACQPAHPLVWIALAFFDAGVVYLASCAASAAYRVLKR